MYSEKRYFLIGHYWLFGQTVGIVPSTPSHLIFVTPEHYVPATQTPVIVIIKMHSYSLFSKVTFRAQVNTPSWVTFSEGSHMATWCITKMFSLFVSCWAIQEVNEFHVHGTLSSSHRLHFACINLWGLCNLLDSLVEWSLTFSIFFRFP